MSGASDSRRGGLFLTGSEGDTGRFPNDAERDAGRYPTDSERGTGLFPIISERDTGSFPSDSGLGERLPSDSERGTGLFPIISERDTGSFPSDSGLGERLPSDSQRGTGSFPTDSERDTGSFPSDSGQGERLPSDSERDRDRLPSDSRCDGRIPTGSEHGTGRIPTGSEHGTDSFPSDSGRDGRRYPSRPVPGVGALIIENGRILLVERGREPLKGYWSLPGGAVETGERLEDALRREVREETGLEVEIVHLLEIFERITPGEDGRTEYHFILMDYICRPTGGTLQAADDASRAEWFTEDEVAGLKITEGTPRFIAKAFHWLAQNAAPTK